MNCPNQEKISIYTLAHPVTGEVRYIGQTVKTLEDRLRKHINSSKSKKNHREKWVNNITELGLRPVIDLLELCDKNEWRRIETFWIAMFKFWGFRLVNANEGGFGSDVTQETKDKISKTNRGVKRNPEAVEKSAAWHRGRKRSEESCKRSGDSKRGLKRTDEAKKKMSLAKKGRKLSGLALDHINKIRKKVSVSKYDLEGNFIKSYPSFVDAAKESGTNPQNVRACAIGKQKTANNYIWKLQ